MTDSRLRQLERCFKGSGSVEEEAAYLLEQLRVSVLTLFDLEVAAAYGGEGERVALASLPGTLLVVQFWAPWNHYDRIMDGDLAALRDSHLGWLLHRVNIDAEQDFASTCRVLQVPTLVGFRRGLEVSRLLGMGEVENWLREALKPPTALKASD